MLDANNPDILIGGYVELDLAATLTETQAQEVGRTAQKTNLKKTLNDQDYNLLTQANSNKVIVMHIIGYNPDGAVKTRRTHILRHGQEEFL